MTLCRLIDGQCRSVTQTDVYVTTQLGYARVSKADGSQELGPVPWEAGDLALMRQGDLQSQVAALRVSKGQPEDGARKAAGTEREVRPR